MIRRAGQLIDSFRPADGPPPGELFAFFHWALRGAMPVLGVAAIVSAAAGTLEVVTALLLGTVIDTALASTPESFFSDNTMVLAALLVFFLILRPALFGLSSTMNSVVTPLPP